MYFPPDSQQHQQQPASQQVENINNKKIDDFYFAFVSLSLYLFLSSSLPPTTLLCYLSNLIRNECWYVLYVLFRKGMLCCLLLFLFFAGATFAAGCSLWNMFHFLFLFYFILCICMFSQRHT